MAENQLLRQRDGSSRVALDISRLFPGAYISPVDLAAAFGVETGTTEYQFAMLALISETNETLDSTSSPYTIRQRDHGIAVLTADEADEFWGRRFQQSVNGLYRAHRRRSCVNQAQLSDTQKRSRERELHVQSMYLAAIEATSKTIAANNGQVKSG